MSVLANKVILFDAVGTLIYADPPVAEVYCEAGQRRGITLSVQQMTERFTTAFDKHTNDSLVSNDDVELLRWKTLVAEVFHEMPTAHDELFDELWQHFARPQSWRLYEDVTVVLARLRQQRVGLGIASNFDRRLETVVRGHEVIRDLQLFWSSDIGFAKPHPQFFRTIEMRLDIAPEQISLIGDDLRADYYGATTAGWNAILLDRQGHYDNPSIASLAMLSP